MILVKAVFLCAGNGRRMLSPTTGIPKPMARVGYTEQKPILEYAIDNCRRVKGIDEFLIVISKNDKMIEDFFGDGSRFGVSIDYVTQEPALGTAHAIKCVEHMVDSTFLVIYGDNIFTKGLVEHTKLIHEHSFKGAVATYALAYLTDTQRLKNLGTAEIDDEHHIIRIVEKSPTPISNYAVTGIMVFEPIIFDIINDINHWHKSERGEYEIHDYTNVLLRNGKIVNAHVSTAPWMDITEPKDIELANELIKAIH